MASIVHKPVCRLIRASDTTTTAKSANFLTSLLPSSPAHNGDDGIRLEASPTFYDTLSMRSSAGDVHGCPAVFTIKNFFHFIRCHVNPMMAHGKPEDISARLVLMRIKADTLIARPKLNLLA